MVKYHEDAYWPNNLSLFAFDFKGSLVQMKKLSQKTQSSMFLWMSLHSKRLFCSLYGKQKCHNFFFLFSVPIDIFFLSRLLLLLLELKKKTENIWTPCKETRWDCKDTDKNIWLASSWHLTMWAHFIISNWLKYHSNTPYIIIFQIKNE